MPDKYIAITIGPIYQTFRQVRKTRELWAASYLFSFLSKRIIEQIRQTDADAVYIPHYDDNTPKGIGLYPDRIFLRPSGITLQVIQEIKDRVLSEIAGFIDAVEGNKNSIEFLKQYFRIHAVQYTIEHDENPVIIGNRLLDTAELRHSWQLHETPNPLLRFFRNVNTFKIDDRKWIEAHCEERDVYNQARFESLIEIATRPIRDADTDTYKRLVREHCYTNANEEKDNEEESFVSELKKALNKPKQKEIFKNYHKYVCVVKADGDRVGKYIKAITENRENELAKVSENLYEWGIETHQLIKDYGGVTIYVGGDDVLLLAPVVGKKGEHIIALCEAINSHFVTRFPKQRSDENEILIKPTLSFGISITYYKFPLNEALQKADELLYRAKEMRHTICLSLLKHSGAVFDMALPLDTTDKLHASFAEVLKHFEQEKNFVSSLIHHFREHEPVYRHLGNNPARVANYLQFNFDEKKYSDLVSGTAGLVSAVQTKHGVKPNEASSSKAAMEETYSMLRILKFLNGHDDGK
jgi:CRISPR-associated protein Cmr2